MPSVLWLIERLARRHDVHVFVLHNCRLVAFDDIQHGLQRRWIDRRAAARATVTTDDMKRTASTVASDLRVDAVPLGIDPHAFPPTARASGPPWRLFRVASLNRVKDYPMLLEALRGDRLDASRRASRHRRRGHA